MNNLVRGILFALMPAVAEAGTIVSDKMLDRVHVNSSGGVYFKTSEPMENPDACSKVEWYHVRTGTAYEKEMLALLLAAKMAGKKVQFYLNGCDERPLVDWVNVSG